MSSISKFTAIPEKEIQDADPKIKNILRTQKRLKRKPKGLPDLESTKESIELRKLETKLSRSLLAILKYLIKNELGSENKSKLSISDLRRKYGFLFSGVFRSHIEEIYRLGGSYGMRFIEIPTLTYFTTERDLLLIRQYTQRYSNRIWIRIDKYLLNRVPDALPIRGEFIVNTLTAEICTYVMMDATKEKTRQVISILSRNNYDPFLTIENASSNNESNNRENYEPNKKEESHIKSRRTRTESAASINPVLGYGPESLSTLLAIKGFSEIKEQSDFSTLLEYSTEDAAFYTNIMNDRYFYMWQTARDDKTCKKYCRPLDGVLWTLKEINIIPLPDQITHPYCRCRIIKIRI